MKLLDRIKEMYWDIVPFDWRPSEIIYRLKCFFWFRYRSVHPRTLPGHTYVDRDCLLVHSMFEILSQFIEKEQGEYKEGDYAYYYKEKSPSLILFGNSFKEPHYVLDYLYRWWTSVYLEKVKRLGDAWCKFNNLHCSRNFVPIPNTQLLNWECKWDTPENEVIGNKMFKRYCKKGEALHKELEQNLILLILAKDSMWT